MHHQQPTLLGDHTPPMASDPQGRAAAQTTHGNPFGDYEAECPICNTMVRSYRPHTPSRQSVQGYCPLGKGGCGAKLNWDFRTATWWVRRTQPPRGTCQHCNATFTRQRPLTTPELEPYCGKCVSKFKPNKPCHCGNQWSHAHLDYFTCLGCDQPGVGRRPSKHETRKFHDNYCMNLYHQRLRRQRKKAGVDKGTPLRARSRVFKSRNLLRIGHQQKHKCAHCKRLVQYHDEKAKDAAHLDHIVPLAEGGPDTEANLQVLCARCNLTKGHKAPWHEQLRAV